MSQIDGPSTENKANEVQPPAVTTKEVVDLSRGYLAGLMYGGKHGEEIFRAGMAVGDW